MTNSYNNLIYDRITKESKDSVYPEIDKAWLAGNFRKTAWCLEFRLLMLRTFLDIYRNPMYMRGRIAQMIFSGLLAISIFWNLGHDRAGIESKIKVLFHILVNQTMMSMFPVLMTFLNEREVFIREYANHTYGVLSYYFAKTVVELPFLASMSVLYALITYFGIGLEQELGVFLWF